MEIRHASEADLGQIMEIYGYARRFMATHGNPNQWGRTHWPPKHLICNDISQRTSYVCVHNQKIVGTFFFLSGNDIEPTYLQIKGGKWRGGNTYGVVHRLAGDGSVKGIGQFCLEWAYQQCGHLRIDTHEDNIVMQNLLSKMGFIHCGTIFVKEDDDPRLAYEKI